jgi:hypothetical protein
VGSGKILDSGYESGCGPRFGTEFGLSVDLGLDSGLDLGVEIDLDSGLDLVSDLDLVSNYFPLEPSSVFAMLLGLSLVPPLVFDAVLEPLDAGDLGENLGPAR